MNEEINSLLDIGTFIIAVMAYLEAKKGNQTPEAINALKEVINASEKTQSYLSKRNVGGSKDFDKEQELAELWSKASLLTSRINADLSVRLSAKSKFWRDPENWENSMRAYKDISLEGVTNDAKELLEKFA